jgi:proteasome lid subunit RPN8/RPN11
VAPPALRLSTEQYSTIVEHCLEGHPDEACGMLGGRIADDGEPTGDIVGVYPCRNADESSRTYTVDSRDLLKAMRDAEGQGVELVGVWHSHTHTEAYPSPTDVRQAADPTWIYAILTLKDPEPLLRAFRIRAGEITEIPVTVGETASR